MKEEWYSIGDLQEFTNKVRIIVFNNFGKWKNVDDDDTVISSMDISESDRLEMDTILSQDESLLIIKEHLKKKKNKYILNDAIFSEIILSLNDRMVSNIMTGLVSKGLVESAFDTDQNDFVFWVKEPLDIKDNEEKPETD